MICIEINNMHLIMTLQIEWWI